MQENQPLAAWKIKCIAEAAALDPATMEGMGTLSLEETARISTAFVHLKNNSKCQHNPVLWYLAVRDKGRQEIRDALCLPGMQLRQIDHFVTNLIFGNPFQESDAAFIAALKTLLATLPFPLPQKHMDAIKAPEPPPKKPLPELELNIGLRNAILYGLAEAGQMYPDMARKLMDIAEIKRLTFDQLVLDMCGGHVRKKWPLPSTLKRFFAGALHPRGKRKESGWFGDADHIDWNSPAFEIVHYIKRNHPAFADPEKAQELLNSFRLFNLPEPNAASPVEGNGKPVTYDQILQAFGEAGTLYPNMVRKLTDIAKLKKISSFEELLGDLRGSKHKHPPMSVLKRFMAGKNKARVVKKRSDDIMISGDLEWTSPAAEIAGYIRRNHPDCTSPNAPELNIFELYGVPHPSAVAALRREAARTLRQATRNSL